ncbi:MAG: hypothetical protein K2Y07_11055 [Nitrosomonas sp.]|nr:hypothetical protein [Nitrosomonas sp.]OQW84053.1 MAG: hypothetical protein BVN30_04270 [Proteobacteria bacterium ST_bin16]
MALTIKEVIDAFDLLFSSLHRKEFKKTLNLNEWGERELLPLVRTYLLGYFGELLVPEAKSKLPGTLSGKGYIDFVIDNVAVEFAVRKPTAAKSNVSATVNTTEVKKLMKYDGLAVLILFDFSKTPYTEDQIENFRDWPSLGKGNHKKSPFNIAYFYLKKPKTPDYFTKNIRVR